MLGMKESMMHRCLPGLAWLFACLALPAWLLGAEAPAQDGVRGLPKPLPGHPGHVFLEGEEVTVPSQKGAAQWRAFDFDGKPAGGGALAAGQEQIPLGRPGIGWYRVEFLDATSQPAGWTSAAVLSGLKHATRQDSPVCVDSATAWFARRHQQEEKKHQEILANLAALAGVNWIRDRLAWGEMEAGHGVFAEDTRYDSSASLAAAQGLNVLQVFHSTPGWGIDKALDGERAWNRFPRDLRHPYAFCKAMAQRFQGRVLAWEPWNEANIDHFGGHLIHEMCSLQKAAYLGFKAGSPDLTVCWNVYAGSGSPLHTAGVIGNEAWPYFETYNIHSYSPPGSYVSEFETAREGACGRPLWISECGIRLTTEDEQPWGDLTRKDERRQAGFIAQSYASSLFAGVERHFFFILGNYIEREVQFGLLRHDHTPRPAYVALAAVGRFLSGAKCLGRVAPSIFAFQAQPDGRAQDVLVAWGEGARWPLPSDLRIDAVFDHLGRPLGNQAPLTLEDDAVFVLLPPGESSKLTLEPPPARSAHREGKPSPVVLQLSLPAQTTRLGNQAHELDPGARSELPLYVYNFGAQRVSGALEVEEAPPSWHVQAGAKPVQIEPMGRVKVAASVSMPATGRELLSGAWIKVRGDFGDAGRPVLAFRLASDLNKLRPTEKLPIEAGDDPANWEDNIVAQGVMSRHAAQPAGVLFEMQFADTDPWAYPRLRLKETDVPKGDFDGLALTVSVLEGTGTVRVQFIEESGAAYLADAGIHAGRREAQRAVVLFEHCKWGTHSRPDPDGKLLPASIRSILVGINSERKSKVKMAVTGLEWVRF